MAVTLETLSIDRLQAQPLGYAESDTTTGLAPRQWNVEGLVRPADWLSLLSIFETWRDARKADADTAVSLSTGTTVNFSGSFAGTSWSNVACWFTSSPSGEAAGAFIRVSFGLIDASQALDALKRQLSRELEAEDAEANIHGTFNLGGTTLTLLDQPDGYEGGPQLERTAAGGIVVNGPLGVVEVKRLNGYTTEAGWTAIKAWYKAAVITAPSSGSYYPASAPTMQRRQVTTSSGTKTTRCIVSIDLWGI
jgi:hypothetical protein